MEGETIRCRLDRGGSVAIVLEDRVYPDRSANQYDAGWWCYDEKRVTVEYFINESGILFDFDKETGNFDRAIGLHVPWMRRVKKMDAELEQTVRDELYNRSFDAYR